VCPGGAHGDELGVEGADAVEALQPLLRLGRVELPQYGSVELAVERCPRDTVQPLDLDRRQPREAVDGKQLLWGREHRQDVPCDGYLRAVFGAEPGLQRRHLGSRPPGGQHRPRQRLVGRVEQRRPQPGAGGLQPPDQGVTLPQRVPLCGVDVGGQHPGRLPPHRVVIGIGVTDPADGEAQPPVVALLHGDADLAGVAVEHEGEAHDPRLG